METLGEVQGQVITKSAHNVSAPSSLDWRTKQFVTRVSKHFKILCHYYFLTPQVKDQGTCGASWAFSATGALEGQLYKNTRTLRSLSEQQLLDCTVKYGNTGCTGGLATNAYRYLQSSGGICLESTYPYLGYVRITLMQQCPLIDPLFFRCIIVLTIIAQSRQDVIAMCFCLLVVKIHSSVTHTILDLSGILYSQSVTIPFCLLHSVAVDASSVSFQYYTNGIYYDTDCSKTNLNHAMLVVGYGTDSTTGLDYWILKNR